METESDLCRVSPVVVGPEKEIGIWVQILLTDSTSLSSELDSLVETLLVVDRLSCLPEFSDVEGEDQLPSFDCC